MVLTSLGFVGLAGIKGTGMNTTLAAAPDRENRYLNRAALSLIAIAVIGFALFNLSGATDITQMPMITHVHAVTMSAWLGLVAVQSILGSRGSITLHRKMGWLGVGLAVIVVVTGLMTAHHTIASGRLPPFFTPGYFLTLGAMNLALFTAFVAGAIALRRTTPWHRRLMLGSIIMIFEPVLGRVIPFFIIPFLGGPEAAFPWILENREALEIIRLGAHLGIVVVIMLGDRLISGRFHGAYALMVASVIALYAVTNTVGAAGPVAEYAAGLPPAAP